MARVVFHKGVFHILCIFRRNHVDNRPKQTLYNIQEWKVECAVMKAEELWGSACKILQEEMTRIGDAFGGRHYTTVMSSISKVEDSIKQSPSLVSLLDDIRRMIKNPT